MPAPPCSMKSETAQFGLSGEVAPARDRTQLLESLFRKTLVLVLLDLLIAMSAYLAAWMVRQYIPLPLTTALLPQERWAVVSHPWIILGASQIFLLYITGLYDDLRSMRYREIVGLTFAACSLQVVLVASLFFFTEQIFPRSVILIFDFLNWVALFLWRGYVRARLRSRVRRTLVVSSDIESARSLIADIQQTPWMGIEIVGLAVGQKTEEDGGASVPVLGLFDQLDDLVVSHEIDEIIFASTPSWRDDALNKLSRLQARSNLQLAILPSLYDMLIGKLRHVNIHDTPLIEVRPNPNEPFERLVKRSFDISAALTLLILAIPLVFAIAAAVKLFSKGPILYRQKRVGQRGRVFELIKFRTMVPDAEKKTGAVYASEDDPRVTRLGRLLRSLRLDELPQLINVLKGDMSFVGPRPERPQFVSRFVKEVPGYAERHKVKPGITGLAQVRGFYDTSAENKLKYDLAYIYNYNFSLDLQILLETLKVMISRRGQ